MPKILVPGWLEHGAAALRDGGCDVVLVVTGAARPPLPRGVTEVHCENWAGGIGASLHCGLTHIREHLGERTQRVVVHLIDYPDIGSAVVERVLRSGGDHLARAVFNGRPGHPVSVPRSHLAPLAAALTKEDGAGPYLRAHSAVAVECGDLATGGDADTPEAARKFASDL